LVVAGIVRIMPCVGRRDNRGPPIEVGQSMDFASQSMVISCVEIDCFFGFVRDDRLILRRFFLLARWLRAD